jgi:hypothetical protein
MFRKAIVKGQFYPAREEELKRVIADFTPKVKSQIKAKGIILPHAGYVYSGKVAVATVSKILPKKRVVILGPNHSGLGEDFSLWAKGAWETPLGTVEVDSSLAESILQKGNCIKEDYNAHIREHSIEVELPIINYFFGNYKFVPICCEVSTLDNYRKVASQIFQAIKTVKGEVLLVASSDMTHYESDASARRKDRLALESIINLDEESLLINVEKENISMCGIAPVTILISCLKNLEAKKVEVALYQTSGDVSGDYSSVVGYAGIIIN